MRLLLAASLAILSLLAVEAKPSCKQETDEIGGLLNGLGDRGGLISRLIELAKRIAARLEQGKDEGADECGEDVDPPGDSGVGADKPGQPGGPGESTVTASPDAGKTTACLDCGPVLYPDDSVPVTTGPDVDAVTSTACPDCGPVLFPGN